MMYSNFALLLTWSWGLNIGRSKDYKLSAFPIAIGTSLHTLRGPTLLGTESRSVLKAAPMAIGVRRL